MIRAFYGLTQNPFDPRELELLPQQQVTVAGRPAQEIARELGISVNAVYVAKSKVLRRLRQELQGLLD